MEIRICPECNKAFYALRDADSLVCQYCGFIIFDRRHGGRCSADCDFNFELQGHEVPAKLKDFSDSGARIVYKGKLLSENTVLNLVVDELGIEVTAKTMWSTKVSRGTCSSGLLLLK